MTGPEAEAHRTQSEYHEQTKQGHGRVETRCAWISTDLEAELRAAGWPGLQSIGMVEATRTLGGKTSVEPRFYLSSLPPDAEQFAQAVRKHWGIENQLQGKKKYELSQTVLNRSVPVEKQKEGIATYDASTRVRPQ